MKTYKIAVMGGDGTGPEVANEAVKVLKAAADKFGFKVDLTDFDFGGERYMKTGETLPDSAVEELRKFDSILLGAIGHPDVKPGILEKGILLKARFELDQYLAMGFHIGITGIVTLKERGAPLREMVPLIPSERLLIETDAPYLTPTPERNRVRRNEPAFVKSVLMKLAEVRGEDPDRLASTTWENTCRLFQIED